MNKEYIENKFEDMFEPMVDLDAIDENSPVEPVDRSKMSEEIYNAIYRLFEEGDYKLTITFGGIKMRLYNPEDDDIEGNVWAIGIVANGTVYQIGDLYCEDLGPGNMAQLLRGDYDIIRGLAECIYKEELSKE